MDDRHLSLNRLLEIASPALSKLRSGDARRALYERFIDFTGRALGEDLDSKVSRLVAATNEAGSDCFGVDLDTARVSAALITYFHRFYFRTAVYGAGHIPRGRVFLVSNHSGQIPVDGVLIAASLLLDVDPPRLARHMVERFVGKMPFVSTWYSRLGQVLGAPENARLLLERGEALVAFPEGVAGISKPFGKRYRLERFGSGFMRLALQTDTPIVPVAVVGAEEQLISIAEIKSLSRLLGWPFPIIPQFFLGMFFPLPTKYHIYFGEPLRFSGEPADDETLIEEKVWVVRNTIQTMIDRGLKERKSVFW